MRRFYQSPLTSPNKGNGLARFAGNGGLYTRSIAHGRHTTSGVTRDAVDNIRIEVDGPKLGKIWVIKRLTVTAAALAAMRYHHAAEQQLQPDGEHPDLRRTNAVKDALVSNGVTAMVISVIGKGETQPHGGNNRGITATVRPNGAAMLSTDGRIADLH